MGILESDCSVDPHSPNQAAGLIAPAVLDMVLLLEQTKKTSGT